MFQSLIASKYIFDFELQITRDIDVQSKQTKSLKWPYLALNIYKKISLAPR